MNEACETCVASLRDVREIRPFSSPLWNRLWILDEFNHRLSCRLGRPGAWLFDKFGRRLCDAVDRRLFETNQ